MMKKIWLSEWGGSGSFSHGRSNAKGVAILFPRGTDITIKKTIRDSDGCYLILQILKGQEEITLVNVYAPTSNDAHNQTLLMGQIHETLAEMEVQNLFIGGDFNVKIDDADAPPSPARETYIAQINLLLDDYSLVDVWKRKNPASRRGTFHRNTYSARLDYIFAPALLCQQSKSSLNPCPITALSSWMCRFHPSSAAQGTGVLKITCSQTQPSWKK